MRSIAQGRVRSLDGLRALAVALVLVDHGTGGHFAGGGVGVNIFFVLSGYLITTLLIQEHRRTGKIRLGLFYLRRVLRLYPALLAMLVVCVLIGGSISAAAVAGTYTTNLFDTFGHAAEPFGHTWSLAAEEQFYLLWPPLLMLFWPRLRLLVATMSVLAVASIAVCAVGTARLVSQYGDVTIKVFNPVWQAHGLIIGVLLALLLSSGAVRRLPKPDGWAGATVCLIVLVAVAASATVNRHWALEWNVAVELASAMLILALLDSEGPLAAMFSRRPMLWLGERSYAVYLWHYPLITLIARHGASQLVAGVLGVVGSLVAAWVSGRWIEAPFLKLKDRLHARPAPADPPVVPTPASAPGVVE